MIYDVSNAASLEQAFKNLVDNSLGDQMKIAELNAEIQSANNDEALTDIL